jgi:hypothetical protein
MLAGKGKVREAEEAQPIHLKKGGVEKKNLSSDLDESENRGPSRSILDPTMVHSLSPGTYNFTDISDVNIIDRITTGTWTRQARILSAFAIRF